MSVRSPRRSRVAILAVAGVAALSVAACSNTSNPPSATTSGSTTAGSSTTSGPSTTTGGEDHVDGLIDSVSGNSAQVNKKTVNFNDSTKVSEISSATQTDVTAGSCVSIRTAHQSHKDKNKQATATSVRISPAVDDKCPQATESTPSSSPSSSPSSAPSSSPSATTSSPAPANKKFIVGKVASVSADTIHVTSTDGNNTQTAVTVNDKTSYTKKAPADTKAITQGKCMTAKGTKDNGGALQATTIDLRPATNGKCKRDRDE